MKWLLANPGSCPEIHHLAHYLSETSDVDYLTPLAVSGQSRFRHTPAWRLLSRRLVGDGVVPNVVSDKRSLALELAFVGFGQLGGSTTRITEPILQARNTAFSQAAAKHARKSRPDIVVVRSTVALPLLRQRNFFRSVLDYPIVHHKWLDDIVRREAIAFPGLADSVATTLAQSVDADRFDTEIDLADSILTLSATHSLSFMEAGVSESKIIELPLGVDTEMFPEVTRVRPEKLRVLFVGQANLRKGIPYFAEVARALRSEFTFTVVGAASASVRRLLAESGVSHVPPVSRALLSDIYAQHDIFYMPTLAEGFPQTPVEALATGMPVIISEGCYGADGPIQSNTGRTLDPRNPDQAISTLRELASDRALLEELSASAPQVARMFTWQRFSKDFADRAAALN